MNIYRWLIVAFWLVLGAYWAIAALGAKRNIDARARREETALRWGLVLLIFLAQRFPPLREAVRHVQPYLNGVVAAIVGVVLCAVGIGLAVWARMHLGRNWGMPMSRKENPELVTTGPYRYVRHPIYTGILLAMLGSAIGTSVIWVLPLVLFGGYFVYSARREEELMLGRFPEQYRAYMERSNMLLPWPRQQSRA